MTVAETASASPGVRSPGTFAGWISLGRRAIDGWVEDGASSMGAALAFYALFSLAPLLLVAIWLASFFVGRDEAQVALIAQLSSILGESAAHAIEEMMSASGSPAEGFVPALIGFFTLVLGATTVLSELRKQLDRIWRAPKESGGGLKGFIATRFFAFLIVLGVGVLLLGSMSLSAFLSAAGELFFARSKASMYALDFVASFVVVTVLFALIYKVLPSVRIAWRDVWLGAAVTSVLFWIGKSLIALYIAKAGVASGFGAAGAVVLLVVWIYYSAQIFFLGAELTREFALRHGSHRNDAALQRATQPKAPGQAPT